MKQTALTLLICLLANAAGLGQKTYFQVIRVKGNVVLEKNNQTLSTRQRFKITDRLRFGSLADAVVVVNQKSSAFLLQPKKHLNQYKTTPLDIVINTRPGKILNHLQLVQIFEINNRILLLNGQFDLHVSELAFPMSETHFFYLTYLWKEDTILSYSLVS